MEIPIAEPTVEPTTMKPATVEPALRLDPGTIQHCYSG
jgi:hypothetical protein